MRVIWIFATSLTLFVQGCKKDGDSKNKDDGGNGETGGTEAGTDGAADADGTDAKVEGGEIDGSTDALSVDTSVVLDVLPIATLTEYAEAEATRTEGGAFTAGTLSVSTGSSLRGSSFALTGLADAIPVGKISAGAPTAMKVLVRKILLQTDDNKASVIFEHATGKEIAIEDGKADLSALLAEGAETGFKVTPGEYSHLVVTYANEADVKGCVSGDFADNLVGEKTYCTKSGKSLYDDCTTGCEHPQFEGAAEWSKMPLSKMGPGEETIQVTYETGENIVVTEGEGVKVTLVVDMNRMLRFYNHSGPGDAPNPSFPNANAYFFTTVFEDATFAFVGEPGRIYGYDMSFHGCRNNSAFDDVGDMCNGGDVRDVGGWMTIVTNKSGKPIFINLMPNDDNDLTISKSAMNMTKIDIGPTTPPSSTKVVINYPMGDKAGKIINFPSLLEADGVSEAVDGVTFEATHAQGDVYGYINITRQL